MKEEICYTAQALSVWGLPQYISHVENCQLCKSKNQVMATKTKKPKIKTPFNSVPTDGEVNNGISKTVPDDSMSVREIFRRFAKGEPLSGRTPIYEGEEDNLPDLRTMDLAEIQELTESVRDFINEQKREMQGQNKKRLKDLEDIEREYKKLVSKVEKEKNDPQDLKKDPKDPKEG